METFSYLTEHPSCISEALDFEGQTPMFTALQFNQFNLGRFCCKMGCNYLHQDTRKRTMLMLAVEYHNMRWVEFFLRVGFDVTMKDELGRNALHYAAEHGGADIIEMMSNDAKCGALMPAELFSAQDTKGWSPVHLAGHCGDLKAMQALIAAGSDIELQAYDGMPTAAVADMSTCCGRGGGVALRVSERPCRDCSCSHASKCYAVA